MESLAEIKQTWSPLRFPIAPLSAQTIPSVNGPMQEVVSALFMRDHGYLVDHQGHSAFCLTALQNGLLDESELSPLTYYPNGYGLHLVTKRTVRKIGSKFTFTVNDALPDASRMATKLARPYTEIPYASGVALAVAEAGLLHDSVLSPIIAEGSDCGYELLQAAKTAVDGLWPEENRKCRNVEYGVTYTSLPFETHIRGTEFVLVADDRNCFYLDWPEQTVEHLEVNILLCKTLCAMSTYIAPFHTPFTAFSCWAQYSSSVSEVYDSIQQFITGNTQSEIAEYLMEHGDADDLDWLGVASDCDGNFDSESIQHAAKLIWQMDDVQRNYSHSLDYREGSNSETRVTEMKELLSQARESILPGEKYSNLVSVLCGALEACIGYSDNYTDIESLILRDSDHANDMEFEDRPGRFYDCIWVLADTRHELLHQDALDCFNTYANEHGSYSVSLPLSSGALVAQVTIPIMERTNLCLALLRKIQLSLEESKSA